ncbi:ABC transporter permease [Tissierella carlieri]|uniref:ABC transporter permease n=1 Tax=Tissierella carlieri TaxID=689904 RepID=UPI00386A8835
MLKMLQIEILKLKHSKVLWIAALAPAFVVFQGASNFLRYYDLFTEKGQNIWSQIYTQSVIFYSFLLLPILITLIMSIMGKVENDNGGWKYALTLPVKRKDMYISKFILGSSIVFINILVFIVSVLIAGKMVKAPGPIPYDMIIGQPLLSYIVSFPIMIIIYIISINFSHVGVPLGLGIGLTLPALLVANTKYWIFYPWTYPAMATSGGGLFESSMLIYPFSIVLFVIAFVIGLYKFKTKDILS